MDRLRGISRFSSYGGGVDSKGDRGKEMIQEFRVDVFVFELLVLLR